MLLCCPRNFMCGQSRGLPFRDLYFCLGPLKKWNAFALAIGSLIKPTGEIRPTFKQMEEDLSLSLSLSLFPSVLSQGVPNPIIQFMDQTGKKAIIGEILEPCKSTKSHYHEHCSTETKSWARPQLTVIFRRVLFVEAILWLVQAESKESTPISRVPLYKETNPCS